MRRRVAVTGRGVATAAGTELDPFWASLMAGKSHLGPLRSFACKGMEEYLTGSEVELPAEDALPADIDPNRARSRCAELALAAARRAVRDAALPADPAVRARTAALVGSTMAEERQVTDLTDRLVAQAPDAVDPSFLSRADNHRLAALLAREHGLGGPSLVSTTACSSGNAALAMAFDLVAEAQADLAVVAGADTFTRAVYTGFLRLGALSKSFCRPFDKRRDGVTFGEGAGALVLEALDHARARGAPVHAEVAGYGVSNDAYHITAPEPSGDGFARAMRQALASSGVSPGEVDYVSAHGTGTPYNDLCETKAMKAVFGAAAVGIPISSLKSMLGHTNGAASAIEAVACVLALQRQAVPPTANLTEPDPECDLDYVPGVGRPRKVETCLNLSAGFGGFNVCLVLRRAP
ncbi:MAG TPA: beta-ketoacyl-[acyl-carrier-protein] synthase family protein [Anaeromyxobacter sp.]|nr:beta-ketoacyl-[acyl-carrier-protein] synthase family protein [Anaeromyxobacter sp.]